MSFLQYRLQEGKLNQILLKRLCRNGNYSIKNRRVWDRGLLNFLAMVSFYVYQKGTLGFWFLVFSSKRGYFTLT